MLYIGSWEADPEIELRLQGAWDLLLGRERRKQDEQREKSFDTAQQLG